MIVYHDDTTQVHFHGLLGECDIAVWIPMDYYQHHEEAKACYAGDHFLNHDAHAPP